MSRAPRDRDTDRSAIQNAAERLLAGTPLRSTSGKLHTTELIRESGLRRDVVYQHRDLVDSFKAQVKARNAVPDAMQNLSDRYAQALDDLRTTNSELAQERETTAHLRRIVAELSIELDRARRPDGRSPQITSLGDRRGRQFFTHPG
jgi:hypothetical protein